MIIAAIVILSILLYSAIAVAFPWLWRIPVVNRTTHVRESDMGGVAALWPISIFVLAVYVSTQAALNNGDGR